MKQFNENLNKDPRPKKKQRSEPINDDQTRRDQLVELPPEMWAHIFSFLPPTGEQFLALAEVNRLFHDLVNNHLADQEFIPVMNDEEEDDSEEQDKVLMRNEGKFDLKVDLLCDTQAVTYKETDNKKDWTNWIPDLFNLTQQENVKGNLVHQRKWLLWGLLGKEDRYFNSKNKEVEISPIEQLGHPEIRLIKSLAGTTRSGLKRKRSD